MLGRLALALLLQAGADRRPSSPFPSPGSTIRRRTRGTRRGSTATRDGTPCRSTWSRRAAGSVHVWADAANESAGFTVARCRSGQPVRTDLGSGPGRRRRLAALAEHRVSGSPPPPRQIELGWFVLGSMRIERDFSVRRTPSAAVRLAALPGRGGVAAGGRPWARVPVEERSRHLALLGAHGLSSSCAPGSEPIVTARRDGDRGWCGSSGPRSTGAIGSPLELRTDPGAALLRPTPRTRRDPVAVGRPGGAARSASSPTPRRSRPLSRDEIFNRDFLDFLARRGPAPATAPAVCATAGSSGRSAASSC